MSLSIPCWIFFLLIWLARFVNCLLPINNCLRLRWKKKKKNLRIIQGIYDTNHKKSIRKDTNFRRVLKQFVLWVQSLLRRKQFFLMETMLKSVAFHLFPFQLVISNFLSYSVKRWLGRKRKNPGDEFWCGISRNKANMTKHKCLLWQLLKLHQTSFSTPLIKGFQIGSLNSMTDLLKRPSATIHCS